ncbi:MAG: FprA family A-type flavoprotein [Lachnospiraceae bacterium]|nr:FprA family A-type flavoprotein [Lachnospiraceae bacterium]
MKITNDIAYVGVNDHELDLFEGQYIVPNGMAYNSYVILDEKIAVMDSVERSFTKEWLGNISEALEGRKPDYLVVQHMEPDHSANIVSFLDTYPEAKVVSSSKSFTMMKNFYGNEFEDRRIVVAENDTLNLGKHVLRFIAAPMVHWPEVIFTYDETDKVIFTADAFGKFGALDVEEDDWACEARRYYFGIVGKYGMQVQKVLEKVSGLKVEAICPLHGPVLKGNLEYYLGLYNTWSSYGVETEGILINFTSVYGNTRKAVNLLADKLLDYGCPKVVVNDLARSDIAECVEDAFRYGKMVLATTTYNGEIFPFMRNFINELTERGYRNRTIATIENGSWAPMATKTIRKMFEGSKEIVFAENNVTILSSVNEVNEEQIDALARELCVLSSETVIR